eukprot:m.28522 g.28522  ORF g.28522 m.28522 type:complete len:332 (+) comp6056_c0_seq2:68-1063(+)
MSEESIMSTNDDATSAKRWAVDKGYWSDPFIRFFCSSMRKVHKPPIINRGYFTRVFTIWSMATRFSEKCEGNCNIVNIGAGFDTLYWRMKSKDVGFAQLVEVDLEIVVDRKKNIISKSKALTEQTGEDYTLIAADLRNDEDIENILTSVNDASLPTLIISECVLVYMKPEASHHLMERFCNGFPSSLWLDYEPINSTDSFGKMMISNLKRRGCELPGMQSSPTIHAHAQRFQDAGYKFVSAMDMNGAYALVPDDEKKRLNMVEFMDEFEEWNLINRHYCVATACNDERGYKLDDAEELKQGAEVEQDATKEVVEPKPEKTINPNSLASLIF